MAARTARRINGSGHSALETAMAMLMQNQTMLMQNQTALMQSQAQFNAQFAETRKDLAEADKKFARIEKDLEIIKAVLVRHETMLEKLPEAIREKIGFKQR